jgi:hypothetical protein
MANIKIPQLGSAQIINDNNYLIVDDGLSTMKATAKQIKEYATNDVKAEIAENWAENVNYTVGNFVNWNGAIYRCIQNHLSSESLTPANVTYWEERTVGKEFEKLYNLYVPRILWENSNPSGRMGEQTIILTNPGTNYRFYTVIARVNTTNKTISTTFIKGGSGDFKIPAWTNDSEQGGNFIVLMRTITASNDNSITVSKGGYKWGGGSWTDDNNICYPLYVIGHNAI